MQRLLTDAFVGAAKCPACGGRKFRICDVPALCCGSRPMVERAGHSDSNDQRENKRGQPSGHTPTSGSRRPGRARPQCARTLPKGKTQSKQKRAARTGSDAETFRGLADRYLVEHSRRHKRSSAADERNLRRRSPQVGLAPVRHDQTWGRDCIGRRAGDGRQTRSGELGASLVSGIFTFGMDAAVCGANPCHRLKKRGPEKVGRRVLSDAEIRSFWNGIVEPKSKRQRGLGLRLTLLTGLRIGEIASISRAELDELGDAARSVWIIPGSRTKNQRDHLLPLSPLARDTILELMALVDAREEYLLPTRSRKRRGPLRGKQLWQLMEKWGLALSSDNDAARTWKATCRRRTICDAQSKQGWLRCGCHKKSATVF